MTVVKNNSCLTLHYRLTSVDGHDWVNTFSMSPATLTLGCGQLAEMLEAKLLGMSEGQKQIFDLPAGDSFGSYNPDLVQVVAKKLLHEQGDPRTTYQAGDLVQFRTDRGQVTGAVKEDQDDSVIFDFNHPLAGVPLVFEVQILSVLDS